jgi:phosphatidylglycerol:prolipoprotein diacylglycerol transferase
VVHALRFSGLNLEFHLNPVAFSIKGINIYWYGLIIMVGMLLALWYAILRAKEFNLNLDLVCSFATCAIIFGVVGTRLYEVAFNHGQIEKFWDIVNLRNGGLAIYGGLIGGAIAIFIFSKFKRINFFAVTDLFAGSVLIGQALGRWGNFFNMEAFGINTKLPWGMTSLPIQNTLTEMKASGLNVDPQVPVHPCFFYESLWCLIGFAIVAGYTKHRKFNSELTLIYAMWYGCGRFFIEFLRSDHLVFLGVNVSQAVSVLFCIGSWYGRRHYLKMKNKARNAIEAAEIT